MDTNGETVELKSQEEVQEMIWKEVHQSRYHLAEEAPICQADLRQEFGYNADARAAHQILSGTYEFSPTFHTETRRLMESIMEFCKAIPEDEVDKVITREVWQQKWKKKREETSSSVSKLHFGHYISGAHSEQSRTFMRSKPP